MTDSTIGALISAVGAVLVALITQKFFWPQFSEWRRKSRRAAKVKGDIRKVSSILMADEFIRERMVDMVEKDGADRAILFNAHNGGHSLKVGVAKYATATFGYAYDPNNPERDPYSFGAELASRYQQTLGDSPYHDMLRHVIMDGRYEWREGVNSPDEMLSNIYKHEGVTHSIVYLFWLDDYRICYCSISTHKPEGFNSEQLLDFDLKASKIRARCEEAHYN